MRKNNYYWYLFWRYTVVGNGLKFFYKKFKKSGQENIPDGKPILFVPNHQNSFMDALLVANSSKPVIYFLTRAKAFKPKLIGMYLWSINMMPVYRVRDGLSSVQKNNEIFDKCIEYLKNNDAILVFAEANHNLKRRIRPLSKGFTRIAFGAVEKFNWDLDLHIVPVGINYTDHRRGRNTVHVIYGESIPVSRYKEAFAEDENDASHQMKEDVSDAMKKLVFHAEDLKEYPVHKILWEVMEPDDQILTDPEISNERIRKTEKHVDDELVEEATALTNLADKNKLALKDLAIGKQWKAKDILLSPLYLFSLLNNAIPYQPVKYLVKNVIKDHAFDASMKFLTGIFLLPLFYLLVSGVMAFAGIASLYIYIYLGISVVTAPLFVRAKDLFLPNSAQRLKRSKPKVYDDIQNRLQKFRDLRESILSE